MNDNEVQNRINFLSIAISDAQEIIKFIDTKAAIIVTILGAYIVAVFSTLKNVFRYHQYYSGCFWVLLIIFASLLIACIIVTRRIIHPTNNPTENIHKGNLSVPDLKFFIAPNKHHRGYPFFNSEKHKLEGSFEDYHSKVNGATSDSIISSLTFELLKISFIRNIKDERFTFLVRCLIYTTLVFVVWYLFYTQETINAKEIVEMLKKYKQ
jgi:hypothetical protein